MRWLEKFKGLVCFNEPLSVHTTLRIGGPADVWVEPDNIEELRTVISGCVSRGIPYFIIGKGSNILFTDEGFRGAVIYLGAGAFTEVKVEKNLLSCGAGLALSRLIRAAELNGLGGLEFLAGIPASVAGAVVMNAGTAEYGIGDFISRLTVMDKEGNLRLLNKDNLEFGYRRSNLTGVVITEACFELIENDPAEIRNKISFFLSRKRSTQDLSSKSAGCVFKNPAHDLTAGEMLDACGLKNRRFGGAEISGRHANYFINWNNAKALDLLYLMDFAREQVKEKFGVRLEPEIKVISDISNEGGL